MATAKTTTANAKAAAKKTTETVEKAVAETAEAVAETFNVEGFEVPEMFRSFAENGVNQAREHYAQFKANAEDATDLMEDTFETSRQGVVEFNHKAVDAAKTNADATFSFIKDIMSVKTLAEAIELQSTFARQQFDALSSQTKEMQELATKLGTDVSAPVKEAVEKSFKDLKVN